MLKLGVNIDHVVTLRQARYARTPGVPHEEPSILAAARACEDAGAHSITIHLREDRRHIQDRDVDLLRRELRVPLNLEMGNAPEIVRIACLTAPAYACLVPENREEITTEGGLDVVTHRNAIRTTTQQLKDTGTKVSLFIDPIPAQIEAAAAIGADMIELHTGSYANLPAGQRDEELARLVAAGAHGHSLGLQINAGHGITTANLPPLFRIPHLCELNIGHHLVSRAIFIGLPAAVAEMLAAMALHPGQNR
ncbi:MAG: pyridoxine 5'-phosphate synthase [Verrucomicrobiota bacterium]|jgi:pyridoxine 5-phosphate synthase